MRIVQFPIVINNGIVAYPDDVSKFRNATPHGNFIVAEYSGALPLDDYTEPEPVSVFISHWKLRTLFTLEEEVAFDNFEENADLTADQKKILRTITRRLESVKDKEVDLKDPATVEALQTLEQFGIIGEGKAETILAYRLN